MKTQKPDYSMNWVTVLWYLHVHFFAIVALWVIFTEVKWMTLLYGLTLTTIAYFGITVGMHRYYAHRTFVASTPLHIFFVLAHTLAGVGSLHNSVLLHRMHHKYFGTDKDPYNSNRGFIYSQFISNCTNGYLEDADLVKTVDMRDIALHKLVWVQHKLYWAIFLLVTLFIPIYIPIVYWNETIINSVLVIGVLRLAICFNVAALVNSAIIVWGLKPTDKYPIDDYSVFWLHKTYWPNYHYVFPRDWKSSEFGKYNSDCGALLIKLWYKLDLVDTLMTLSSEQVRDVLYEMTCKKMSVTDTMEKFEQLSSREAIQKNLRFRH